MNKRVYQQLEKRFASHADSHWAHLSRINNLLIVLNISMFFLTDLVLRQGVLLYLLFTGFPDLDRHRTDVRIWFIEPPVVLFDIHPE